VAAVDAKRGGEASWAAGEVDKPRRLAVALHDCQSLKRFDSADEDGSSDACGFADDIEHEVRAIVEENIDVPPGEIHRANAGSRAAEVMPGGITRWIGFRFHDAAAEAALRQIMNDDFSDEEARELYRGDRELGPADAANIEIL